MITYKIDHPDIYGEISIKDKLTTIEGPSNAGKTFFIELYEKLKNANVPDYTYCDVPVCNLDRHADEHRVRRLAAENPGCVFLCDECVAGRISGVIKQLDCYALIACRKYPMHISSSYQSVYLADRVGIRTHIRRKFEDLRVPNKFVFDTILVEDSGAGYKFFKEWVSPTVIPCGGKYNIKRCLTPDLAGPYVHVIFDAGGISGTLAGIMRAKSELETQGYCVVLWTPECFEQLLLGADFINFDGVIPVGYGSMYSTSERFCEDKIEELTIGTKYEYHHRKGFKTNCWLQNCSENCGSCTESVTGDKGTAILQHGPLPELLRLKQAALAPHYFGFDFGTAVDWCLTHPREIASIPRGQGIILQPNCWQIIKRGDNYFFTYLSTRSVLISLAITDSGYYMPHGFSYSKLEPLLRNYAGVKPAPFD